MAALTQSRVSRSAISRVQLAAVVLNMRVSRVGAVLRCRRRTLTKQRASVPVVQGIKEKLMIVV